MSNLTECDKCGQTKKKFDELEIICKITKELLDSTNQQLDKSMLQTENALDLANKNIEARSKLIEELRVLELERG